MRRRLLGRALLGGMALVGTTGYAKAIEPNDLEVTRRVLPLPGWPSEAQGLRVGHLSDFHCDTDHAVHRTQAAVEKLLAEKPDIVFLTGDFITLHPQRWVTPCFEALAPLAQVPRGVFAVPGNHDWNCAGVPRLTHACEKLGFTMLQNQSVPVSGAPGVWVVGLDDVWAGMHDVTQALQGVPGDAVKLLLVHEPDYAAEAPPGFALQLSGHSHGGQVCLPLLPPLHTPVLARIYKEGLEQAPHHLVYTTRGIGMIGMPVRLFCPPEVTVLDLVPGSRTENSTV